MQRKVHREMQPKSGTICRVEESVLGNLQREWTSELLFSCDIILLVVCTGDHTHKKDTYSCIKIYLYTTILQKSK